MSVVFLYGPRFSGRTLYYKQHLCDHYERVDPDDIYKKDKHLTIRQLVYNYIVEPLKQGRNVAIDDSFQTSNKRRSYLRLLRKKVSQLTCICYKFLPENGSDQLYWTREFMAAELTGNGYQEVPDSLYEEKIDKWLCTVDPPDLEEGFTSVKEIVCPLKVQSNFQFEVPALFIQWEAILTASQQQGVTDNVTDVINIWCSTNPCGRILLIADEHFSTGDRVNAKASEIKKIMESFIKELCCPVYVMLIQWQIVPDDFIIPPKPGVLAYLQRLHCLNLYHPGTVYLYHTSDHMKMAAYTGMKYVKASHLFAHPKHAQTNNAALQTKPLMMLQNMEVIPYGDTDIDKCMFLDKAAIPLYNKMLNAEGCCVVHKATTGRMIYAFVKDAEVLQKYQLEYQSNATRTSTNMPSRLLQLYKQHMMPHSVAQQDKPKQKRKLPQWMLSVLSQKKSEDKSVVKKCVISSQKRPVPTSCSKTVYVLSADELVDAAKLVLLEAGESIPCDEETQACSNSDIVYSEDEEQERPKVILQKSNSTPLSKDVICSQVIETCKQSSHSDLSLNLHLTSSGTDDDGPQEKKFKSSAKISTSVDSSMPECKTDQLKRELSSENINLVGDSFVLCFPSMKETENKSSLTLDSDMKCEVSHPLLQSEPGKCENTVKTNVKSSILEKRGLESESRSDDDDAFSILDGLV